MSLKPRLMALVCAQRLRRGFRAERNIDTASNRVLPADISGLRGDPGVNPCEHVAGHAYSNAFLQFGWPAKWS